jgi:16S rRNA (cytidine1402-2'-O)-methyltransferase
MGTLYLIPTPVGNLEDITLRAIRLLKEVDMILAEDTRKTNILLKHFDIKTKCFSHHKFNEHQNVEHISEKIFCGTKIALVTDAGTPAISDPGFLLVRACVQKNIKIECLPGATAFVPALVSSALPCEKFCFEGFLPQKKGRLTAVTALKDEKRTMIFYESPFRVVKTLALFAEVFGENRMAAVSREISKKFEETIRGTLAELMAHFNENAPKGEFVIVVSGKLT